MPDQPLQPFPQPTTILSYLPGGFSAGLAVEVLLFFVFVFWAVYTLVAIYHWLKYSHGSWLTFPAIAIHLAVSVALMGYTLSGNGLFLSAYLPT